MQAAGTGLGASSGPVGSTLLDLKFLGPHRIGTIQHANGLLSQWRHDDDGRLIRVDHLAAGGNVLESSRYRHELYNRRRVVQHSGPPAANHLYRYDARGRLVEHRGRFALPALADQPTQAGQQADIATAEAAAAAAALREDWNVDASDTRRSVTETVSGLATTTPYTPGPGHKIVAVGSQSLLYDADGRRIGDGTRAVVYDALGRVVRIDDAATAAPLASFEYDPLGRWSGGVLGGQPLRRLLLDLDCIQEENGAGAVMRQFTWVPGMLVPLVASAAGGPTHLHFDGAHNLVLVSNSAGAAAERFRYTTFGEPRVFDGTGSPLPGSGLGLGPWFGGLPYLQTCRTYFSTPRLYDPASGQFLARDPYLHLQSPSPYVYALHDPVNGIDPTGALPPLIVAGLIVGGIGAAIGVGSVLLSGEDYDGWDVLAGAVIGFGAGFIGGVTFGWAAGAIGGGLLGMAGGSAAVAATPWVGTAITVASGVGAGAFSGLASGVFSGASGGVYHGGIRGRGDMWQMIGDGAYREGISGMAAGAVGGGLFQGALRLGRPGVPWAQLQRAFGGGDAARVIGRGFLSPYGLGGGIGIGSRLGVHRWGRAPHAGGG